MMNDYYIGENDFRVFVPNLLLSERSEDVYNSRRIAGVMSTERRDRQDETVLSKGLDFSDFLQLGHFNDNHSQLTSAIVGYPERAEFHKDLGDIDSKLKSYPGWTCEGYILKGTKRSDDIWELAKTLTKVPNRKLGFSIEGKVIRRSDKCIEKAKIRNVAITNCPVNTDATWNVLEKSFFDSDYAIKAMSAGYATGPSTQSNGGALRTEDLDADVKENLRLKKKKRLERALMDILGFDELLKAMEYALERRDDLNDEAAAMFAKCLIVNERKL